MGEMQLGVRIQREHRIVTEGVLIKRPPGDNDKAYRQRVFDTASVVAHVLESAGILHAVVQPVPAEVSPAALGLLLSAEATRQIEEGAGYHGVTLLPPQPQAQAAPQARQSA